MRKILLIVVAGIAALAAAVSAQVSHDRAKEAEAIRCDYIVTASRYGLLPIRLCGEFPTQTNIGNVDDIHVRKFKFALQDAGYEVTIRATRLVPNPNDDAK
jgi:hypothetical protein